MDKNVDKDIRLAIQAAFQDRKVELVYANDWEWLLIDGYCLKNGHSLDAFHVLDALGIKYTTRSITSQEEAEDFDPPGAQVNGT